MVQIVVDRYLFTDPSVLHLFLLKQADLIHHLLHPGWMTLRVKVLELSRYLVKNLDQSPIRVLIHCLLLVIESTRLRDHSQPAGGIICLFR